MQIYFKELNNGYTVIYDEAVESFGFDEEDLKSLIKKVDKKTCGTDIYIYEPEHKREFIVITIKSELIFPVSANMHEDSISWRLEILTWALKSGHSVKFLQ